MGVLEVTRGDSATFTITVVRPDEDDIDQPVPLAGATLWFTAKAAYADIDDDAVIQKVSPSDGIVFSDPTGGIALCTIDPADTDDLPTYTRLVYDCQLLESDGTLTTLDSGQLTIPRDVTRAEAP